MKRPSSADFDGDQFNRIKSYGEIANESVRRIRKAGTLDKQCELIVELTDVSRTQMRNMSRRRKKITVQRYNKLYGHYDFTTGILVSPAKSGHKWVKKIPIILEFTEKVGKPMTDLFEAWAKLF